MLQVGSWRSFHVWLKICVFFVWLVAWWGWIFHAKNKLCNGWLLGPSKKLFHPKIHSTWMRFTGCMRSWGASFSVFWGVLLDNGILSARSVLFGGCTGWGVVTLLLATINDTSHLVPTPTLLENGRLQVFFFPKKWIYFFNQLPMCSGWIMVLRCFNGIALATLSPTTQTLIAELTPQQAGTNFQESAWPAWCIFLLIPGFWFQSKPAKCEFLSFSFICLVSGTRTSL